MNPRLLFFTAGFLSLLVPAGAQLEPAAPQRPPSDIPPPPTTVQPALTFGAIADKILPSVVTIHTSGSRIDRRGPVATGGSGFVVSAQGYILTWDQVIGGADVVEVVVGFEGGFRTLPARVVNIDPDTGVALLQTEPTGLPAVPLGNSSAVRENDLVIAAGAALRPHRSVARGVVIGIGRGEVIESDIPIAPQDAGGPLVDSLGRVIGITMSAPTRRGGPPVGPAIPINAALPMIESLTRPAAAPVGGSFLGVQIRELPGGIPRPEMASRGAVVQMVGSGSPAELAGVQVNDVITAVDNTPILDGLRLRQVISGKAPGTEVTINVVRDGNPLMLKAVLMPLPTEAATAGTVPLPSLPPAGPTTGPVPLPPTVITAGSAEMLSGLTTSNLTPELRQRHAIPDQIQGVLVTQVLPDSRAAAMGVEQGDVITQVNRKPVLSVEEARVNAAAGDKTVLVKVYRHGDSMLFMVGRD